jgi:hypothetical protein
LWCQCYSRNQRGEAESEVVEIASVLGIYAVTAAAPILAEEMGQ